MNFIRRIKINSDKVCDKIDPSRVNLLTKKVDLIHKFGEVFSITLVSVALLTLTLAIILFYFREHPKIESFN